VIPDEAVEAAARAAAKDEDASNWDDESQYYQNGWLNRMQVALEAAAPHLKHVRCEECGKCRVVAGEEWCIYCEYWSCERGEYCADAKRSAQKPTDAV